MTLGEALCPGEMMLHIYVFSCRLQYVTLVTDSIVESDNSFPFL